MPELPEVFTITKNLIELLPGCKLVDVEILENHRSIPKLEEFNQINYQSVKSVDRIAKYILINFDKNTVMVHLGMTGRLRFSQERKTFGWDKIILTFENSLNEKFYINYTDTRKFGKVKILEKFNPNSGYEPIKENDLEKSIAIKKILVKNSEIKNILLDQKIIAGLGNIYANDTLFDAKINPTIKGKDLSEEKVLKIINSAKKILNLGIEKGGSSLRDKMYTDIYGNLGFYQDNFLVYDQPICKECGHEIVKIKIKGRTTFYCPLCQKI